MCQECTATWEGVNYCHPCLTARAAQPRVRSSAIRSIAWGAALLALLAVTGRMMAWSAALLARMF